MSKQWDGKTWIMDAEDPRNLIPVAHVFVPRAQFEFTRLNPGVNPAKYKVTDVDGTPEAWLPSCELTEIGNQWQEVIGDTYPLASASFLDECRSRFGQLQPSVKCLVGSLWYPPNRYLCDVQLFQIQQQTTDKLGSHDLLIIHVNVPYGRQLNNGSGYGHS